MRAFLFLLILAWALPAAAARVEQPHSTAELVPEQTAISPGGRLTLGLHLRLEDGWHVYWKNPGDAGMPTQIAWMLPEGYAAAPMQWPAPMRIDVPPLTSYGYEGEVMHLIDIHVPASATVGTEVPIRAKADWLVCREICIPASADFSLTLPVSAAPARSNARWSQTFASARTATPAPLTQWQARAYRAGNQLVIRLAPEGEGTPRLRDLQFFPAREGVIANAQPQQFTEAGTGYELRMTVSPQPIGELSGLAGVLVADPSFGLSKAMEIDLPVAAESPPALAPPASGMGLAAALLLAVAGGLILNLMPCVFPVLAIKVLSVTQQAHGNARRLRIHGVLFGLGVVVSFWAIAGLLLALRATGAHLGWGYQLQSPVIVAGLAILFFGLGLNLSGVFQIGAGVQALSGGIKLKGVHTDALLSGLLAAVVASPCTAPFMGAALGFALVQPAAEAMLVFTALALGMALPYMLLCFVPALIRRLPRPGPWMETLKQALAFPLYATVVWLVWVLGQQAGIDGAGKLLAALVAIAAALWTVGRWARARRGVRWSTRVAALALIAGAVVFAWPHAKPVTAQVEANAVWRPWSEAAVRTALAAGKPVFVDFTAAWCVTCQVNKRLVLNAAAVEQRFSELQVVRLRADWTKRDAAITDALARLNRSGVPVYALYSPTQAEPLLLPELLTRSIVLEALEKAATPEPAQYALHSVF